jgi:hypothetical protein
MQEKQTFYLSKLECLSRLKLPKQHSKGQLQALLVNITLPYHVRDKHFTLIGWADSDEEKSVTKYARVFVSAKPSYQYYKCELVYLLANISLT